MTKLNCAFISLFLVSAFFFSLASATAEQRLVVADFSSGVDVKGIPPGWRLKENSGKADISVVQEGPIHALRFRSKDSSFSLQKSTDVNLQEYPLLSWKWKVTQLPVGGDFRKRSSDDQAAQLFLGFSNSKVIVYIWDSSAPMGVTGNTWSPPFMTIKAVVVRSGHLETGRWLTETRNVYEDYRKIFGKEPPKIEGLRLQINSQHTKSSAESFFADIAFEKR